MREDGKLTRRETFTATTVGLGIGVAALVMGRSRTFPERVDLVDMGITILPDRSTGMSGAKLLLDRPGRYIVEVFVSGDSLDDGESLVKSEFSVASPRQLHVMPRRDYAGSVLVHVTHLDPQLHLATKAVTITPE